MTVATVRLLISDPPAAARAERAGDGATVEYRLPNAPVIDTSVRAFLDGVETGAFTVDAETGVVTFTGAPADGAEVVITYLWVMLSDTSLQSLLTLEGDNDKLAAAQALDIIADSEALIQKKIEHLDLKTDGPAVSRALREHAKALRQQVQDEDLTGDQEGLVDYAEMGLPVFARSSLFWKQWSREN